MSGPLEVESATGSVVLTVVHAFDFEFYDDPSVPVFDRFDAFDGAQLNLRVNGGAEVLVDGWSAGGYGMETEVDGVDGLGFEAGWWGRSAGEVTSAVTLAGLAAGDRITFAFEAGWDPSFALPGPNWTIRRIEVTGAVPVPEPGAGLLVAASLAASLLRRRRGAGWRTQRP
jgi:hypothetical protein